MFWKVTVEKLLLKAREMCSELNKMSNYTNRLYNTNYYNIHINIQFSISILGTGLIM